MHDLSEKFGPMPELLEDSDFTLTDYLRQAPPQEMRLFVWTLEEHRERYPACSALLDEYFEMGTYYRRVTESNPVRFIYLFMLHD